MKIHIGHHFFGAGNLGDDLMLAGFIRAWLERGIPGTLTCATPFERSVQNIRFPQIDWLPYSLEARTEAIRNCTVWLGLGGSAFQTDSGNWLVEHIAVELDLCKRFHKPMFYLCVDVGNWQALSDPINIAVLDYVEHIWTRDVTAAERIRGVLQKNSITAGADLSHLYLARQTWPVSRKGSLAWLITNFNSTASLGIQEVALAINALPQWQHHWLIQEIRELSGSELEILHALPITARNKLTIGLPDYTTVSTDLLLENWPNCETVITSRFHGALVAGWRGAHVAVIERNDKLSGLAGTLGCQSILADWDATSLCSAIASSTTVKREVLEQQFDVAMKCCDDFFYMLQQRYFIGRLAFKQLSNKEEEVTEMTNKTSPMSCDSSGEYCLSSNEVDLFHKQGFLGPFTATPEQEISRYTKAIEDIIISPASHTGYPTQNRHLDSLTIWELCNLPAIVDRLVSLYGSNLILWDSNIFDKESAEFGQPNKFPWHQDMWNWQLEPMMCLTVWVALTTATPENGCIEFIPGSHTQEIPIVQNNDPKFGYRFAGRTADPSFFNEADKVPMVMTPGQFCIFNEAVLHHSNPNLSHNRRIGLAFRITATQVKTNRTLPCLLLSGIDRFNHNPITEPPLTDPDITNGPSINFLNTQQISLADSINGMGWHLPEQDSGTAFRWMGPQVNSWLDLPWNHPNDAFIHCEILHAVAPQVLLSLRVLVNDYPVALSWAKKGSVVQVEGHVPASALQGSPGVARVSLLVNETLRFCDLHLDSNDTRWLSLAISQISLRPFDGN